MDVCTSVKQGMSLVALTLCLTRMLYRLRSKNQRWRIYTNMLVNENRWRAMRYSYDEGMIDFGRGEVVPFEELLAELMGFIEEDAQALNCVEEINRLPDILTQGTSAHRQVEIFEKNANERGLINVVDWLIAETVNF